MSATASVHVVMLTPEGRGAVATLLVAGPGATGLVGSFFHSAVGKRLEDLPLGRIVYGRFRDAGGEELIVCRRAIEEVEVHCHGGAAAAARWIDTLAAAGAQRVDWRQWLTREGARGRDDDGPVDDPIAAAATIALAAARTQRTASILLDQLNGALRREIDAIRAALTADETADAQRRLRTLLDRAALGQRLTTGFQVVLAGRPNVGKSSLTNALVGYQRAIVFDQPGTTRNVVTAHTAIDGWPVELSDTAGLRASNDPIEICGVQRAQQRLSTADAVVLVFDASLVWSPEDTALLAAWPTALVVHNKCDLPTIERPAQAGALLTSALTGEGIDQLLGHLAARLVPNAPEPGAAVPFTHTQTLELQAALDAVSGGDAAKAADALAAFGRCELP